MTIADRLLMLDVLFDLRVTLAPDGAHVILRGPPDAVAAASPMVALFKPEIVAHLRTLTPPKAEATGRAE